MTYEAKKRPFRFTWCLTLQSNNFQLVLVIRYQKDIKKLISSHVFDEFLPKKNLQNGVTLKRHCKPAFTKQVLPRFSSPQTPATASRNSATQELFYSNDNCKLHLKWKSDGCGRTGLFAFICAVTVYFVVKQYFVKERINFRHLPKAYCSKLTKYIKNCFNKKTL